MCMTGAFNRTCTLQKNTTNKNFIFSRKFHKSEPYQSHKEAFNKPRNMQTFNSQNDILNKSEPYPTISNHYKSQTQYASQKWFSLAFAHFGLACNEVRQP